MRGWDVVTICGDVVGFDFGTTDTYKDEACTISLLIKKRGGHLTSARINIYGEKVQDCKRKLEVGCGVMIKGELMNRECRKVNDKVLEIRGQEIEFFRKY